MSRGSCLCGDVSWDVEGPYEFMSHCHCSRCRKTHGSAFATYVAAPTDRFRLQGGDRVVRWLSPGALPRCFCGRCGSVVPGDPWEGRILLPAGNFEDDPGARPIAHIFVASKAPWFAISDELPRFDAYPEGVDVPVIPDRPPLDPPGRPRGSCLCGAVAFVVEGTPTFARFCHCSRCRRARSAACAANLLTKADGVRFTRGASEVSTYKVPEARFFSQVFCRTCGSAVPRFDPSRDLAVVPMGALDDDPGIRPSEHIFVGSKAPWHEITDDLARHEELPPA